MFHTPPATPIARHEKRTDDARIETRRLEYQRTELPKPEDIAKQTRVPSGRRGDGIVPDVAATPRPGHRSGAVAGDLHVVERRGLVGARSCFPLASCKCRAPPMPDRRRARASPRRSSTPCQGLARRCRSRTACSISIPARYQLLQFDVDGAGLKVMNFARSLRHRFDVEARVDPVTTARRRDRCARGANGRLDAGATLARHSPRTTLRSQQGPQRQARGAVRRRGQHRVAARRKTSFAATASTSGTRPAVAGNRCAGATRATSSWRTPSWSCRRPRKRAPSALRRPSRATRRAIRQLLYLHEALVSWTGWSLAAPPPGRRHQAGRLVRQDRDAERSAGRRPA